MGVWRKTWVEAKANAVKANGGKDIFKVAKIKNLNYGAALDAWEAAEAKFKPVNADFDGVGSSKKDVEKWFAVAKPRCITFWNHAKIAEKYEAEFKKAVKAKTLTREAYDILVRVPMRTGAVQQNDKIWRPDQLAEKIANYRAKAT